MTVQSFDNFDLLNQFQQATRQMAQDMINNAHAHKAMAAAQTPDLATLASYLNDAARNYLAKMTTALNWASSNTQQTAAALTIIAATPQDLSDYMTPLQTAAQALLNADKSSYAAITAACDALLAAVPAPASIYGT